MLTRSGVIQCDFCGKFISWHEIIEQKATHSLVTPDSDRSKEQFESYHNECLQQSRSR